MSRPRILDLFCKAGGAGKGYADAGFEVVGVDIEPQPRYPFEFHHADALEVLRILVAGGTWQGYTLDDFDAIHASPPCQAFSTLRHRTDGDYPDLIAATREHLRASGRPYVIENVVGAPLVNPLLLCGSSFGLGVDGRQLRRHRQFESNVPMMAPPCQHIGDVVGVYGTGGGGQMTRGYKARGVAEARETLSTPWMTLAECAQAIPPAYTSWVGSYLLVEIRARAKAAA
jgi:DNA (cytosine-5)-methyltransferase 1